MGTYQLKDYARRVFPKRIKKLGKMNSTVRAGNFMIRNAIALAARKTGATINGIRGRPDGKNRFLVTSFVHGFFKQNLWANQTPPFLDPKMFWNQNKPTVYGDGSHRTTGTPGFFNVAGVRTRKKFKDVSVKEFRKIMRS